MLHISTVIPLLFSFPLFEKYHAHFDNIWTQQIIKWIDENIICLILEITHQNNVCEIKKQLSLKNKNVIRNLWNSRNAIYHELFARKK